MGIEAVNPFELPLINTVILLSSGFTVTYAHHSLIQGNRKGTLDGLVYTVGLALIFTAFQAVEYSVSFFSISDGTFGSCFYFGTGLTLAPTNCLFKPSANSATQSNISPSWLTGFADAESSFSLKIGKDEKRYRSITIKPDFSIELHRKDLFLLKQIQCFFGVGNITKRIRQNKLSVIYSVQSVKNIQDKIIPHFEKHRLNTQKREDFRFFTLGVNIIAKKLHRTEQGINDIISCRASMNKGLTANLLKIFPNVQAVDRNIIKSNNLDEFYPFWLTGFVDGEGCFYIKMYQYNNIKKVSINFSIYQNIRDLDLLKTIRDYLNCGIIETVSTRPNAAKFVVYKFEDIICKIIPFFDKYGLHGIKKLDYYDFRRVASIISKNKNKLDEKTFNEIKLIKSNMNTSRILS